MRLTCVSLRLGVGAYTMHMLPPLITTSGTIRLPLVDRTAERLVGALLEKAFERRREAFHEALAGDPALALWTLLCAERQPEHATAYLSTLAGWLASARPEIFSGVSRASADFDSPERYSAFAEPAGISLAVAELAAELAPAARGNGDRAQLLGLVHLAVAWLSQACDAASPTQVDALLPDWLLNDSLQLSQTRGEQSTETACVAQAIQTVLSVDADAWRAIDCDAAEWVGRWEKHAKAWAAAGPWPRRLAALVEQLQAKQTLEVDFGIALENAKLEAIKEFAYGAGHEINNPLANISARAQTLLADETDRERRRTLAAINSQAFRAHEMIADMMLFARPPEPKWQSVELDLVVRTVVAELLPQAEQQQTELAAELPPEAVSIEADPAQISIALRSLCQNSLEALVQGGRVRIELVAPTCEAPRAVIKVSDNGPGIPADVRRKIFEPYYSGREAGRGLGLGLSKCWRIVRLHGGTIEVMDGGSLGDGQQGSLFAIQLPVARSHP
jgi:signal transduction histidine kinase